MLEDLFFLLGLVNNVFLIFVFLVRKNNIVLLQRVGSFYFLLAIPAIYGIFLVQQEQKLFQYSMFLAIFLAFLAIENIYDFILKIPFRENQNWKLLTPYLILYFAQNYGFVVMVWKTFTMGGIIMLILFIIQIILNIYSHPPKTKLRKINSNWS